MEHQGHSSGKAPSIKSPVSFHICNSYIFNYQLSLWKRVFLWIHAGIKSECCFANEDSCKTAERWQPEQHIIKGKPATRATTALLSSLKAISCVSVTSKQKSIDGAPRGIGKGLQQVGFEFQQIVEAFWMSSRWMEFTDSVRIPACDG